LLSLNKDLRVFLLFLAVGAAVYANAFQSPFIRDDPYLIAQNHLIEDIRYLPEIFTHHLYYSTAGVSNFHRPLQTLLLMLDYAFWGTRPFGYHLTSVLFHVACAFVAFKTLQLLFERRGVAYDHQGKFQEAVEAHRQSLKLNPYNPKIYNNLGNVYYKTRQFENAIEVYQRALEFNPHYKAVYNNLGAVYFQRKEIEKAAAMWRKVLEIDPNFVTARDNLLLMERLLSEQTEAGL
jgi:hypothetical protein